MDPISLYNIQQTIAPTVVGGRLELESSTEIQWKPYYNYSIGLYDGEDWKVVMPSGLIQAFIDSTTISGSGLSNDTSYDVYAKYESQDNFTLEFQEWAGNNSRYEAPTEFQGVLVRNLTTAGKQMRWLGIIRVGTAEFLDEDHHRYIFNHYNKKRKSLWTRQSDTNYYQYSTETVRECNGGSNWYRAWFICNEPIEMGCFVCGANWTQNTNCYFIFSVNFNTTTSLNPLNWRVGQDSDASGDDRWSFGRTTRTSIEGLNYMTMLEYAYQTSQVNAGYQWQGGTAMLWC